LDDDQNGFDIDGSNLKRTNIIFNGLTSNSFPFIGCLSYDSDNIKWNEEGRFNNMLQLSGLAK
jgi:hypothetical protein